MRRLLLLTFSFRLFAGSFEDVAPSSSEEILSLTTDLLIDGFVSVTSGQVSISEVDLTVRGAQDLVLKRTYVPPRKVVRDLIPKLENLISMVIQYEILILLITVVLKSILILINMNIYQILQEVLLKDLKTLNL